MEDLNQKATATGTSSSSAGDDNAIDDHFSPLFEQATTEERSTRVSERHVEEEEHCPSVFEVGESSTGLLDDDEEEDEEDEEMEDPDSEEEYVISKSYNKQPNKMQRHYQTRSTRTGTGTGTYSETEDSNQTATATGTSSSSGLNKYNDLLRCDTTTEEEPEVMEPECPKTNPWNAFEKEQMSKGEKNVHKIAEIWNGMSMDEKQKYGKNEHKVRELREQVRCVPRNFFDYLDKLGPERRKMLEDSPFYKLLEMERGIQDNEMVKQLANLFNLEEKCIEIEGVKFVITADDFSQIMGVEDGEEEINMPGRGAKKQDPTEAQKKSPTEAEKKLLAQLRRDFMEKGNNISIKNVETQLGESLDEDNVKRAFALLALRFIIFAPSNGCLSGSFFLDLLQDVSGLHKKKWATFAIEKLVEGIRTYKMGKGKTEKNLGGCTIFLQLFAEKMIPEENLPRKRKRDKDDCSDCPKTAESVFLVTKETIQKEAKKVKVFCQKEQQKSDVINKKDPVKKAATDALFSELVRFVDKVVARILKTLDECMEGLRQQEIQE